MQTTTQRLSRVVTRHRFAVLGYSAEDEVWCPKCLREAAGLTPDGPDSNGRPILPLFAADKSVLEERCTYCGTNLLDLLPGTQPPTLYKLTRKRVNGTIVTHEPVGTFVLNQDGSGVIYFNHLSSPCQVFSNDGAPADVTVLPKPPVLRKRATAAE